MKHVKSEELESLKIENAELRERLDKWNKGYNSVTKAHYQAEIESLKAQLAECRDELLFYTPG